MLNVLLPMPLALVAMGREEVSVLCIITRVFVCKFSYMPRLRRRVPPADLLTALNPTAHVKNTEAAVTKLSCPKFSRQSFSPISRAKKNYVTGKEGKSSSQPELFVAISSNLERRRSLGAAHT